MIFTFIAFIYVFFVTYYWGIIFLKIFRFKININPGDVAITVLVGLIAIITCAAYFSLFFRINWEFQVLVLIVALLICLVSKPFNKFPIYLKEYLSWKNVSFSILFLVAVMIIINATTLAPKNPDTGIYHAQAIRWIETYPVVPGLANYHIRFGYNSSWLLANAVFSFSFIQIQSFHFMTGFLYLIAILYFSTGLINILKGENKISDLTKSALIVALFIFILDKASSPETDVPAAVMTWIIICLFIDDRSKKLSNEVASDYLLLALIVFAVTLKLNLIPIIILIIPILFFPKNKGNLKYRLTFLSAIILIYLPHAIRSLIITGYPVFPGLTIDLFRFDWRLPEELVRREPELIHWFASSPNSSYERFKSLSTFVWLSEWYAELLPRYKALVWAVIGLALLMMIFMLRKSFRKFFGENLELVFAGLVIAIGIVFWFISAPAIRFGYGFILGWVVLMGSIMLNLVCNHHIFIKKTIQIIIMPVCLTLIIMFSQFTWQISSLNERIFFPVDYPSWPTAPCEFKNFSTLCAQDYNSCWYAAFPCAVKGNPLVELRGRDFIYGFRSISK